jgi:hypothetical protein
MSALEEVYRKIESYRSEIIEMQRELTSRYVDNTIYCSSQ